MSEEIPRANPPLSDVEQSIVAKLTEAELQVIDATILANSSNRWLKVARVIYSAEAALKDRHLGLTYIFYAERLIRLTEEGHLESQGNLKHMRFSEVRIPAVNRKI